MIKCKEDLVGTFTVNTGDGVASEYLSKCEDFDIRWLSGGRVTDFKPTARYIGVTEDFKLCQSFNLPAECKLITLKDFEEEEPKQDKCLVSQYKYTPLEVESIFELKEHLEKGKLFYGKPDNMKKIQHEWGLMKVIVEDEFRIHLLEEVKWQDEVISYLSEDSDDSFVEELPSKIEVKFGEDDIHYLVDSEFLEMCRVALRATGELK